LPQMQARVTVTSASVGSTTRASGTFSIRTSPAPNMTVARMVIYLCFPAGLVAPTVRTIFPSMLLLMILKPAYHNGRSATGQPLQVFRIPGPLHSDHLPQQE